MKHLLLTTSFLLVAPSQCDTSPEHFSELYLRSSKRSTTSPTSETRTH